MPQSLHSDRARPSPDIGGDRRPRLGLALGGGSARGWAHIGVIRELAASGIAIDVVTGTSIGAVVGACYAAGKLDILESFARGLNRRRVLALMDVSLGGTGLIAGGRLSRRLGRDLGGIRIETLTKPFAAVATELGSGREVDLVEGDLIDAIRASYALPGIFEPVQIGGRWLFDGALSNPVPVSVCRALGADLVVAVNLTSDLPEDGLATGLNLVQSVPEAEELARDLPSLAQDLPDVPQDGAGRHKRRRFRFVRRRLFARRPDGAPGIASVMVGAFSIAQERISRSRLASEPPDVMIGARLASVGLFDFHRAGDLIAYGREVARRALPEIEAGLAARRSRQS